MSESRKEAGLPAVVGLVLILVVIVLGVYAGTYIATSKLYTYRGDMYRTYRYSWQAMLYTPAAWAETMIRRHRIRVHGENDEPDFDAYEDLDVQLPRPNFPRIS